MMAVVAAVVVGSGVGGVVASVAAAVIVVGGPAALERVDAVEKADCDPQTVEREFRIVIRRRIALPW